MQRIEWHHGPPKDRKASSFWAQSEWGCLEEDKQHQRTMSHPSRLVLLAALPCWMFRIIRKRGDAGRGASAAPETGTGHHQLRQPATGLAQRVYQRHKLLVALETRTAVVACFCACVARCMLPVCSGECALPWLTISPYPSNPRLMPLYGLFASCCTCSRQLPPRDCPPPPPPPPLPQSRGCTFATAWRRGSASCAAEMAAEMAVLG